MELTVANDAEAMDAVTLTTTAGGTSPPSFVADTDHGLHLSISACEQEWTEAGTGPSYTYTCLGAQYDVLGSGAVPLPILQTQATLSNLTLDDGAVNHLRVRVELPTSAPSSMLGQSETITFTFTGVQRSGALR